MMIDQFVELFRRVSELEKRVSGSVRHGRVAEVNAAEGWVRLDLGEGDSGEFLSPKVPYAQMAGALKVHTPPTKGQNMTVLAPGGDIRQAIAMPMSWSKANASPSDKGDENVLTFGQVVIELRGDEIVAKVGPLTFKATTSEFSVEVGGVKHVISGGGVDTTGGGINHDGKNIGSTHRHGGVVQGGATTAGPQ